MDEPILSSLLAFKLLMGKGHLEEVKSEEFHEEKNGEECWKNTSNIRQNIQELKVSAVDISGDGGSLKPKVGGG